MQKIHKTLLVATVATFLFGGVATAASNDLSNNNWQNSTIFHENREDAHAWQMPYANTAGMRADARYGTPWLAPQHSTSLVYDLAGTWQVCVSASPTDAQQLGAFYADGYEPDATWEDMEVPSCIEMKSTKSDPYYVNDQYIVNPTTKGASTFSWSFNGYYHQNTVASYLKEVTLPTTWSDNRIFLHFDGIYSAAYVWLNGQYVGYTQGANNSSEFDVTPYVRHGQPNRVAVQVIRFSDGTFLEGQDMWHMTGIHRDVYFVAYPKTFVRDHVLTSMNGTEVADGTTINGLRVKLEMDNRDGLAATKNVRVRLYNADGTQQVGSDLTSTFTFSAGETTKTQEVLLGGLSDLKLWTAETPNLYTVEVAQFDSNGNEELAFCTKHGFRTVKQDVGRLLVNGTPVILRGVNSHDTHPLTGRTVDTETMLKDIRMMKAANINAFRTSHYPRNPRMYAMMDYYGLYCMDEADIESHANWAYNKNPTDNSLLGNMAAWQPAMLDRVEQMVVRDRNFPSIIIWSTGNESGITQCHGDMYNLIKTGYNGTPALDPTRPVSYEGYARLLEDKQYSISYTISDFEPAMYYEVDNRHTKAAMKSSNVPYIQCEYAHAMGQAVGRLQDYWDVIEAYPDRCAGAFIWDWCDQSIYNSADILAAGGNPELLKVNGYPKYMTGSDYPTSCHQGNFVNNGILTADRAWTAKLDEVKMVYQCARPIAHSVSGQTVTVTIKNKYSFTTLSRADYHIYWEVVAPTLKASERIVESGTATMTSIAPGATGTVSISLANSLSSLAPGTMLNVYVHPNVTPNWVMPHMPTTGVESDTEHRHQWVGAGQFELKANSALPTLPSVTPTSGRDLTWNNSTKTLTGEANGIAFTIKFNNKGMPTSMVYGGQDLITAAPEPNFFRWIENDNDPSTTWLSEGSFLFASGHGMSSSNGTFTASNNSLKVVATYSKTGTSVPCSKVVYTWYFYKDGTWEVKTDYTAKNVNAYRLGTLWRLNPNFDGIRYFARGPRDNFYDRKSGSFVGFYQNGIDEMMEMMTQPQTSGYRSDVTQLSLFNQAAVTDQERTEPVLSWAVEFFGQANFQYLRHLDEDMKRLSETNPKHTWDMSYTDTDPIYMHIDYGMRGLGNHSCAGEEPDAIFSSGTTYSHVYRFTPVYQVPVVPTPTATLVDDGNTPYEGATDVDECDVTYLRTFTSDAWQALYVPFNLSYSEFQDKALVAELTRVVSGKDGSEQLVFTLVQDGELTPHKPYIIKPTTVPETGGVVEFVCPAKSLRQAPAADQGVQLHSAGGNYSLYGTYATKGGGFMYNNGYFGVSNGAFLRASGPSVSLPPYRIYLQIPATVDPSKIRVRVDGDELGDADAIIQVIAATEGSDNGLYYDLLGRAITNPAKGVYIRNGRKVVLK